MPQTALALGEKSRLRALLEHFSVIDYRRVNLDSLPW